MIMGGEREGAVMAHPEQADHREADEIADEAGNQIGERLEVGEVARAARQMRRVDLDDEQGDRDREHRVGEEDQPLQRMIGLDCHARPLVAGGDYRRRGRDDNLAVQRIGDEAALVRFVVERARARPAAGARPAKAMSGRSVIRVIAVLPAPIRPISPSALSR